MLKKAALFVHRWLGLISGLLVFIIALAGTLYAFQPQIDALRAPAVSINRAQRASADTLIIAARRALAADSIGLHLTLYREPGLPFQAELFIPAEKEQWTMLGSTKRWETAFIDPYTSRLLSIRNEERNFLELTRGLHTSLLLNGTIGPQMVAWSVVTFVVIGLTGLIAWWPASRKALKHRLRIKTDAPSKKLTYDLHTVLGFYVLSFVLTFAGTGLMWSFHAYEEWIVQRLNTVPASGPAVDTAVYRLPSLDAALDHIRQAHPDWKTINISSEADPSEPLRLRTSLAHGFWRRRFTYDYDRTAGTLTFDNGRTIKGFGDKINASRYNLHTGQALGLPGQVLVFGAGLICASLPITGLLMYLNNRRKPKKKGKAQPRAAHV